MAVVVRFEEWYDASRLCDAALNMVEVHRESNPAMSQRYQKIADALGDALDAAIPEPSDFRIKYPRSRRR